jgi:2-oxoglutarate dehydrogenase E2 component (dihydrolipoamide succinyltransferase)
MLTRCRGRRLRRTGRGDCYHRDRQGTLYSRDIYSRRLTSQIDVSVNAPEAGTIKEFLVNEEDTVTVGQDIVKLELGGEPSSGKKEEAKSEPKEAASNEQETSSQPKGGQEKEQPKQQEEKPQPPKQESKPEPPKQQESKPAPQPSKPSPPKESKDSKQSKESESKPATIGGREERRVCIPRLFIAYSINTRIGQDEPHASTDRRAP